MQTVIFAIIRCLHLQIYIAPIRLLSGENKEYSKISEEIEELANYGSDKEIYVFNTTGKILLDIENIILYVLWIKNIKIN